MDFDTVFGCIVIAAALGLLIGLVAWSRRTIERIARGGSRSARQILRELHDDR